jgi:hypothetical protein
MKKFLINFVGICIFYVLSFSISHVGAQIIECASVGGLQAYGGNTLYPESGVKVTTRKTAPNNVVVVG